MLPEALERKINGDRFIASRSVFSKALISQPGLQWLFKFKDPPKTKSGKSGS